MLSLQLHLLLVVVSVKIYHFLFSIVFEVTNAESLIIDEFIGPLNNR